MGARETLPVGIIRSLGFVNYSCERLAQGSPIFCHHDPHTPVTIPTCGRHGFYCVLDQGWASVDKMADIPVDGQRIILCHYGLRVWNAMRHGTLMLYGHSHSKLPGNSQSCDVGVDDWQYMPVDLPQIRARLATLPKLVIHDDTDEPGIVSSTGLKV